MLGVRQIMDKESKAVRKSLRSILVVICICMITLPAWAEMFCSRCGRILEGKYYRQSDGTCLCLSCYNATRLRCSVCGKAINGPYYKTSSGAVLCENDHLNQLPRCAVCGKRLSDKYYTLNDGRVVCKDDLYKVVPSCSVCGKVLTGRYYKDQDNRYYCEQDFEKQLPVCAICGKKLKGVKYKHYSNDEYICINCDSSYARCLVCKCPTGRKGMQLSDGRVLCPVHLRHAVFGNDNGLAIYNKAKNNIISMFGSEMELRFPVSSVELMSLDAFRKVYTKKDLGLTIGFCQTLKIGPKFIHRIYALDGYPPEHLLTTMAHEYGHAWQSENNTSHVMIDPAFQEGFCQWLAYKMNERLGRQQEMQRLLNYDDPEYGDGLRAYLNLEHGIGVKGVLWAAKTKNTF